MEKYHFFEEYKILWLFLYFFFENTYILYSKGTGCLITILFKDFSLKTAPPFLEDF